VKRHDLPEITRRGHMNIIRRGIDIGVVMLDCGTATTKGSR